VTNQRPAAAPLKASFPAREPIDLRLTLAPLGNGRDDPTIRFGADGVWLARRTVDGPATLRVWMDTLASEIRAEAWGPGSVAALEAAPGLAGLLDEPGLLEPRHPLVFELQRRFSGVRLPRTGQLLPSLLPAITGQKVTAGEAHAAYAAIVRRLGDPAPGSAGLLLSPSGARLAELPYFEFHPLGLERRRAEAVHTIGRRASEIEALMALPPGDACTRLQSYPGIGPWTAAEATRLAFGDPDAVSLRDAHLPDLVAWALAGEPRADDSRMLELLAPYPGQRARVIRLLEVSGIKIPRFGPRFGPRRISRI
jgi:3-methyladenine DNA glycosylase/8-oxoguanine DNA glycosylase